MSLYRSVVFPLLKSMDAEAAHDLAAMALQRTANAPGGAALLRAIAGRVPARPVDFCGLRFANPIGVAAGFDKDVRVAAGLGWLGFGHVEVGTLTPRPQAGNPKPRVFRLVEDGAVINRMGFPNGGVLAALPRLRRLREHRPPGFIVGVSLGKQKETELPDAARDYEAVLRQVYPWADYLAVNISSPNTPGLRELQGGKFLEHLCKSLIAARDREAEMLGRRVPLLVKIAPDMSQPDLEETLGTLVDCGVDGLIATNTTLSRDGLRSMHSIEAGGMSGAPLASRAREMVRKAAAITAGKLPIIGVGGVRTADDVRAMQDAGAALVQVYTGMIYEGPGLAAKLMRGWR